MTAYIYVYVDIIIYDICTIPVYVYVYIYIIHIIYVIYIIYTCMCVCLGGGGGGCIYVYCSSPYLYIVNTKFLMGFLLSLKIRKNKQEGQKVWKFQGSTKKEVGFPGVLKKKSSMEYPWLLVFDFGISRGSHTIFQNFHR